MRHTVFYRALFYAAGLLILALGLTLNTKTGLGVSPIISVAYSISEIFDQNFGNMTLALYSTFVVIEMILHLIRNFRYRKAGGGVLAQVGKKDLKWILLMDFLQIPLSIFVHFVLCLIRYFQLEDSGSFVDPDTHGKFPFVRPCSHLFSLRRW